MSGQLANIHDAFFKQVMSDPELAGTFLREHLPPDVTCRRPDLPDYFGIVLAEASELSEQDLFMILTYLDKSPTAVNNRFRHESPLRLVPKPKEQIVGWLTQPYYDKGRAEGIAEGEVKGEAKALTHFLERRFGGISTSVRQRIFAADIQLIQTWIERAVDAPDLQSVFEPN